MQNFCYDCIEFEYSCYMFKNVVKVKIYIGHFSKHPNNPDIYLNLDLDWQKVNYVSISLDIDLVILETSSVNKYSSIIIVNKEEISKNR